MRRVRAARGEYRCILIEVERAHRCTGPRYVAHVRRATLRTPAGEAELPVDSIEAARAETWQEAVEEAEIVFREWVLRQG